LETTQTKANRLLLAFFLVLISRPYLLISTVQLMLQCCVCLSSAIASHSPLNITETVRHRGWSKLQLPRITNRNDLWAIKWSRDRCRHVTLKGQTRDPNRLRAQYLENSWRCYLAAITIFQIV